MRQYKYLIFGKKQIVEPCMKFPMFYYVDDAGACYDTCKLLHGFCICMCKSLLTQMHKPYNFCLDNLIIILVKKFNRLHVIKLSGNAPYA